MVPAMCPGMSNETEATKVAEELRQAHGQYLDAQAWHARKHTEATRLALGGAKARLERAEGAAGRLLAQRRPSWPW